MSNAHEGGRLEESASGVGECPRFAPSRRQMIAGALAAGALTALGTSGIARASALQLGTTTAPDPFRADPRAHLRAFQDIADRCGGRAAGTSGYEQSAQYVEQVVRSAGYSVHRQEFDYVRAEVTRKTAEQLTPTHREMQNMPVRGVGASPEGGHTAQIVRPNNSYGDTDASWEGVDVTGKIALIEAGGPEAPDVELRGDEQDRAARGLRFQLERDVFHHGQTGAHARPLVGYAERIRTAARAGAVAVLFFHPELMPGVLVYPAQSDLPPATAVDPASGAALLADLENGEVTVHLDVEVAFRTHSSFNVLASRPGAAIAHLSGAHLDSVPDRPGINDNASGAAVLLEAALALPAEHTMGFAWWGAEEYGLHGSLHYVAQLEGTPEFDVLEKYLNLDMVASPNYVICALGDGDDREPYATHFDTVGQPWVPMIRIGAFVGGSDHAAFAQAGVPWVMLTTGASDLKTPEEHALFGGTIGEPHDANYHTPDDDLGNVNSIALDIMTSAQIAACSDLVRGPRPGEVHERE